ncbi:hypothetical protein Tco_0694537 [Tanacetum coccineum]
MKQYLFRIPIRVSTCTASKEASLSFWLYSVTVKATPIDSHGLMTPALTYPLGAPFSCMLTTEIDTVSLMNCYYGFENSSGPDEIKLGRFGLLTTC